MEFLGKHILSVDQFDRNATEQVFAVAEEMHYVLENAEVKFIIAENHEQVDKVIEIKDRCPLVESVVYDDPRGLRNYQVSYLHDYADLLVDGRKYADQ